MRTTQRDTAEAPPRLGGTDTAGDADPFGEVFSVVCHDLRDPLSAIVMGSQLLLSTTQDERSRRVLEAIGRAGDRIGLLVQNAATLRAPRLELRVGSYPVKDLLISACGKLDKLAVRKSVRVERRFAVGEEDVVCDRARIEEMIVLLGDNAIRHAAGRPVVVTAKVDGATMAVAVSDSGEGIAKDRLPTLFDWVFNARQATREGTGLGLAAAKRIVQAHDGTIGVKSRIGQGSTFHVAIPLTARAADGRHSSKSIGGVSQTSGAADARHPGR